MVEIVKFPVTAYERLIARSNPSRSLGEDVEIYHGECAAAAWRDTIHAKKIAHRVSAWITNNSQISPQGLNTTFPPGWHFCMVHGRHPRTTEEVAFWAEMKGDSPGFRIGFTRGLVQMVTLELRSCQ